jgi:glyoxylase-like metal-dependent hydrolase (beta-lactamase superfamily II)
VDALADWIETKGRRLSRVYITHGHGDHWLGLARLIQRFPGVIGLATAEVLAQAGLLPDRRRGDHHGRHRCPDGRSLSRLGEPPHTMALRADSHRAEEWLAA